MKDKKTYISMDKAFSTLAALLLLLGFFSCSSDWDEQQEFTEETPMEFEFLLPENEATTRVKTGFALNDRIYLTAAVKVTGEINPVVVSSILEYDGSKFNPVNSRLKWPAGAVEGKFVAYYYPASHNTPPTTNNPVKINLSDLQESSDDLLVANQNTVSINGIVLLRFAHTTTKLRFNGLRKEATSIELVCKDNEYKIKNQIVLTYSDEDGYKHEFVNDGINAGITLAKEAGDGKTQALFFLNVESTEWEGKTFTLTQRGGEPVGEIKKTDLTSSASKLYTMQKGRAYRITFYGGSVSSGLEKENEWYKETETRSFTTIGDIKEYFAGEGKNGLMHDLDFNNLLLDDPAIVFPQTRSISLDSKTFNGNYHTIRNVYVKNGLFGDIPTGAKIINLRLENVKVISEGVNAAGLLAPSNNGTIENVRIGGDNNIGTHGVPYVGGLVGINNGTITGVQMSGALTMDVYIKNESATATEFAVGGLVGYNNGAVSTCEINTSGLLKLGGKYTGGDMGVGGLIGYHAKSKTVNDCSTYVNVDATQITAKNSYVGGFCGINRGTLTKNEANGEVKGGSFTNRSATGGFVGYTTSLTEKTAIAVVNGCGASGNVIESNSAEATDSSSELYTGGFCGFSEIDLKNVYSVGTLSSTDGFGGVWKQGSLAGLISADKTVYNSFSITQKGGADLTFNGDGTCKTQNAHYRGKMLTEQGIVDASTTATVARLNNAVSTANGYWSWNYSTTIYEGAPYLVKQ